MVSRATSVRGIEWNRAFFYIFSFAGFGTVVLAVVEELDFYSAFSDQWIIAGGYDGI